MSNPKIAVIGIPDKWSTEVLADRLEEKTGFRKVLNIADLSLDLASGKVSAPDIYLNDLDGVIVKKISEIYEPHAEDRLQLLQYLESQGVKVFSSPGGIRRLINRLSGTLELSQNAIPMPATRVTESVEQAVKAVKEFGAVVIKPLYSTKARGMLVLTKDQPATELKQALVNYKKTNKLFYIQQKLDLKGRDLGMAFLGNEYLCTYARVSGADTWNTTIHSGGRYEAFEPDQELIELGRRAQQSFGLAFTTVDIALTDDGPVVFEVSAFGGFKGALKGCGIDAAERYAEFVVTALSPDHAH